VLSSARSVETAQFNMNYFMDFVLRRIENLSLEVAPEKTEAVLFRGGRRLDHTNPTIRIRNSLVRVSPFIKYLGVLLDSRLNFKAHFNYIDGKLHKVIRALGRLMPNLRGPQERKRRLYAGILDSVVLYASPIWASSLNVDARRLFRRWQRAIAIRVCSAYRTVSFDSATLLARLVPLELLAAERTRIFWRICDAKEENPDGWMEAVNDFKRQERGITQEQWIRLASRPRASGARLRDVLLPHMPAWVNRRWGGLTFRITQLLTGHGCFGNYLYRIGKADTAMCQHCGLDDDSSSHTIESCSAWLDERTVLINAIGPDLSLLCVLGAISTSREAWRAFARFVETVMLAKEDAERAREAAILSPGPFDPG